MNFFKQFRRDGDGSNRSDLLQLRVVVELPIKIVKILTFKIHIRLVCQRHDQGNSCSDSGGRNQIREDLWDPPLAFNINPAGVRLYEPLPASARSIVRLYCPLECAAQSDRVYWYHFAEVLREKTTHPTHFREFGQLSHAQIRRMFAPNASLGRGNLPTKFRR